MENQTFTFDVSKEYANRHNTETNKYQSEYYGLFIDEYHRDLYKTHFLTNTTERLEQVKQLVQKYEPEELQCYVNHNSIHPQINPFKSVKEQIEYEKNTALFYLISINISYKRTLEITVYIDELIQSIELLTSVQQKINTTIDKMYQIHTGVLDDPKADFVHNGEINALIYDILKQYLYTIQKPQIIDVSQQITTATKGSLKWNAQKNIIGTLFGLLHKNGAISGSRANVEKALCSMFPNLSISTIQDNIKLKVDPNKGNQYDTETENTLSDFIDYLKTKTN